MKTKIYILFAICTLFTGLKAVAQSPVEYMNSFSTEYQKIQQDMWDYTSSVSHGKSARKSRQTKNGIDSNLKQRIVESKISKSF